MSIAIMILIGISADLVIGWPNALFARIGHPVTWLGALISACEVRLNHGSERRRFWCGGITVVLCLLAAGVPTMLVQQLLPDGAVGLLLGGLMIWPWLALRSMHSHVAAVSDPLTEGHLAEARQAVSMIVGRDPAQLDSAGIARAATESLAENTSDGIVAPVFWALFGGLPGIAVYKAVNTLDSMIGHRSDRYEYFGKIAARLDDVLNWIPARLCGVLFAISAGRGAGRALRVMRRDAGAHRSPNAGWPEGAMAGALDIRLSGPRIYGSHRVEEPWLNGAAPDPVAQDLGRALRLYRRAMAVMVLALVGLALV